MRERERERERERVDGTHRREEKCVVDCEAKRNGHTHACLLLCTHKHTHTHTHTDYPGLILPAQDRKICSELIKCLPLTYAGASG